ncbi:BnaC04g15790D [Brassica napus]|uniref:BnaC04g15790D protein n=1 Tax=Brassica napus TaxID=3708 RepID=A0A078FMR9_BRANA|nr:BnaC04g15790D [Brassica napus]
MEKKKNKSDESKPPLMALNHSDHADDTRLPQTNS